MPMGRHVRAGLCISRQPATVARVRMPATQPARGTDRQSNQSVAAVRGVGTVAWARVMWPNGASIGATRCTAPRLRYPTVRPLSALCPLCSVPTLPCPVALLLPCSPHSTVLNGAYYACGSPPCCFGPNRRHAAALIALSSACCRLFALASFTRLCSASASVDASSGLSVARFIVTTPCPVPCRSLRLTCAFGRCVMCLIALRIPGAR
jgi:hypothetical protein